MRNVFKNMLTINQPLFVVVLSVGLNLRTWRKRMSDRYSEHLDKGFPECTECDSALGFYNNEYDEGTPNRCFTCEPLGTFPLEGEE